MNSVHVRVKIVGLLQQGDLQGVLQMAGRLERIEQRYNISEIKKKYVFNISFQRPHAVRIDTDCESEVGSN